MDTNFINSPKFLVRFALFGQKSHGKTTFANALVDELNRLLFLSGDFELLMLTEENMRYHRCSFVSPIKYTISTLFDIPIGQIEELKNQPDYILPRWNVNMRTALEKMGGMIREIYPEFFTDVTCRIPYNIVVDDGRLDSEVSACDVAGFNTILVYRPSKLNNRPTSKTEEEMLKYYTKINDGKFDEIEDRFCGIVMNTGTEDQWIEAAKQTAKVHFNFIKEELKKRAD